MGKKINSIFINQLIHFFSPHRSLLTLSVLCFLLPQWKKKIGKTAEQAIGDNPELEAIIDYCTKRAASFILILP